MKYHLALQFLRFGKKRWGRKMLLSLVKENPLLFKNKRRIWEALKRLL
jgi:hypothetical protein